MGFRVDAVELVEHNIEVFRKNTQENERITVKQGNALDLSAFSDNQYDITLILGPLYHLYTIDEKRQAIREAIRVTKPGGILFAAYVISDGCLLDEGFHRNNINVMEYIQKGLLDADGTVGISFCRVSSRCFKDDRRPCGFTVCMGISRSIYGRFGEKVDLSKFMIFSGLLCTVCYPAAGVSNLPVPGLISCALFGFSVGIMWPGSISISSKILSKSGTAMFALLALAGDLGGSVGSTIIGTVYRIQAMTCVSGCLLE